MSAVCSKRLGIAVLTMVVGTLGLHSVAAARDGLPPIHESSVSTAAPPPPPASASAPAFSARQLPLEQRITRLERLVDNQALFEMLARLEDLQLELQTIRGELELQRHEFDGIKQRQRDLYLDIDRRILQLEKSGSGAPTAGLAPQTSNSRGDTPRTTLAAPVRALSAPTFTSAPLMAPAVGGGSGAAPAAAIAPAATATLDPLQEQSAYQQALNILREGRYDEAIVAFQSFLARFQGSQYSGNAQYWIGEANYVSGRYPEAIEEFQKVLNGYPKSSKVPDAMLKIGYTFYELKDWDQTRQTLANLVERFPKTTAAQLADNRLHRMKLEGH